MKPKLVLFAVCCLLCAVGVITTGVAYGAVIVRGKVLDNGSGILPESAYAYSGGALVGSTSVDQITGYYSWPHVGLTGVVSLVFKRNGDVLSRIDSFPANLQPPQANCPQTHHVRRFPSDSLINITADTVDAGNLRGSEDVYVAAFTASGKVLWEILDFGDSSWVHNLHLFSTDPNVGSGVQLLFWRDNGADGISGDTTSRIPIMKNYGDAMTITKSGLSSTPYSKILLSEQLQVKRTDLSLDSARTVVPDTVESGDSVPVVVGVDNLTWWFNVSWSLEIWASKAGASDSSLVYCHGQRFSAPESSLDIPARTVPLPDTGGPYNLIIRAIASTDTMTSNNRIVVGPVAGIEEQNAKGRIAYPENTASVIRGALRLSVSPSTAHTSLFNMTGRQVMALVPGQNDVRALAPGVYFVRLASGVERQASSVQKVVITR